MHRQGAVFLAYSVSTSDDCPLPSSSTSVKCEFHARSCVEDMKSLNHRSSTASLHSFKCLILDRCWVPELLAQRWMPLRTDSLAFQKPTRLSMAEGESKTSIKTSVHFLPLHRAYVKHRLLEILTEPCLVVYSVNPR